MPGTQWGLFACQATLIANMPIDLPRGEFVHTVLAMPLGKPKKFSSFRIDPELLDAVRALTTNVTEAVEEGLRLWVARAQRRRRGETRSSTRDSREDAA